MDPVTLPPISTSGYQSLGAETKVLPEPFGPASDATDAVHMAILREGLAQLELELADLVITPHSHHTSTTASDISSKTNTSCMSLADVKEVNTTLSLDYSYPTLPDNEKKKTIGDNNTQSTCALYTLQAADTPYEIRTCAHCSTSHILIPTQLLTDMQDKIADLALRGIQLVKDKAHALQKANQSERTLAMVTEECNEMERVLEDARSTLSTAWWEVAALKSRLQTADVRVRELEDGGGWIDEDGDRVDHEEGDTEHVTVQQRLACKEAQRIADRHRILALEAALAMCKQENSALEARLWESSGELGQAEADKHHIGFVKQTSRELMERIRVLEEENARLVNVEADCQALVEMRAVQEQEREEQEKAWRISGLQVEDTIQEMQTRNAYLENRVKLCEEERAKMQTEVIRSSGNLLNASRSRLMGRGWNLSSMSLRRPKKRGDEEEGSFEHTIRR